MVRKTRRLAKKAEPTGSASASAALTIPQLRKSFEHIEKFVQKKVLHMSEKEGLKAFCKEWKKTFGTISEESAKDYLQYMRSHNKTQKGGAVTVLSPAGLGYEMSQPSGLGVANPSYPAYLSGGFLPPPMDSVAATCGKPSAFLPPAADTGSNAWVPMKGGGRSRSRRISKKHKSQQQQNKQAQRGGSLGTVLSEFLTRPFGMGSPPTMLQDVGHRLSGQAGLASPRPEINTISFTQPPTVFNASIGAVPRLA
jgi:hypothetical protein